MTNQDAIELTVFFRERPDVAYAKASIWSDGAPCIDVTWDNMVTDTFTTRVDALWALGFEVDNEYH